MVTVAELRKAARAKGIPLSVKGKALTKQQLERVVAENQPPARRLRYYQLVNLARQHRIPLTLSGGKYKTKEQLARNLSNHVNFGRLGGQSQEKRLTEEIEFLNEQLASLYKKYSDLQARCRT